MPIRPVLVNPKPRVAALAAALLVTLAGVSLAASGADAASSGGITNVESTDDGTALEGTKYERLWDRVSRADKRWAHRTSECESGGDPDAIGGGGTYRGAFQFMRSTWKAAPKSPGGDPIDYTYRTQAVVAVMLKRADGAQHWPGCG